VAWAPSALRAELEAGAWAEQRTSLPRHPGAGGRFQLVAARGRGCLAPEWRSLSAGPCAGLEVDHVIAESFGEMVTRTNDATWLSASGGVFGVLRVTRWLGVRAAVDATVPLARTSFVVLGEGTVHRVASVSPRASIGLEFRIP
jgi:hypothetical protein